MQKKTLTTKHAVSYNRHNRRVCLLLAVIMLVIPMMELRTYVAAEPTLSTSNAQVEQVINFYAMPYNRTYTIADKKELRSLSGGDVAYTLYSLNPFGYAIFLTETNTLMQACLTPDAQSPIDVEAEEEIYYGGPNNYFTKSGNRYEHISENLSFTADEVNLSTLGEAIVRTSRVDHQVESAMASTRSVTGTSRTKYALQGYFSNLSNHGENKNETCVVLAASMLIGCYDYYYDDDYVASIYESGNGTSQAFHELLNVYVYGQAQPADGGTLIIRAAPGINDYLDDRAVDTNFSFEPYYTFYDDLAESIIGHLEDNRPVVVTMFDAGPNEDWDHGAVVYGVTYNTSDPGNTAVFTAHMGWGSGYRATLINAAWLYEHGFIECGKSSHAACKGWLYYSGAQCYSYCDCGEMLLRYHQADDDGNCTYCGTYVE